MKNYFLSFLYFYLFFSVVIIFAQDSSYFSTIDTLITTKTTKSDSLTNSKEKLMPVFFNHYEKILTAQKISKNILLESDYKYLDDLFNFFPFTYSSGFYLSGFSSMPVLFGNISENLFLNSDGFNNSNRISGMFNALFFQEENIDSILLFNSASAFLFSDYSVSVGGDAVSKQIFSNGTYSRIKIYQASENEGIADVQLSRRITEKLNLFLSATNNSVDSRYENSVSGGWRGTAKLNYLLSNNTNLNIEYFYLNFLNELNGGVDYDSLLILSGNNSIDEILYDNLQAPVQFGEVSEESLRYRKLTKHFAKVSSFTKISDWFQNKTSVYFDKYLNEFRQNEYNYSPFIERIKQNNRVNTIGMKTEFRFNINNNVLLPSLTFENNRFIVNNLESESNLLVFSFISNFDLFSVKIMPYGKYSIYEGKNYFGFGLDSYFSLNENISLSGGLSNSDKIPNSYYHNEFLKHTIQNETVIFCGAKYLNSLLTAEIKFSRFEKSSFLIPVFGNDFYIDNYFLTDVIFNSVSVYSQLNYSFFELNVNYNQSIGISDIYKYKIPNYSLFAGLYYKNIHFNQNLKLKTGLNFYLNSGNEYSVYDFLREEFSNLKYNESAEIQKFNQFSGNNFFRVDFFLSGLVQEAAYLYITLENLLDAGYYNFSYYPGYSRTFRFGISWEFND